VLIVLVIAASSALAAFEAVTRLAHPHPVSNLVAVAIAALIGFTGNGVIARYGIGVGRRIRSAALVVLSGTDFTPFLMRQARSAPGRRTAGTGPWRRSRGRRA
jgi:divalent metal cation (Fe/Co/Zn/Cd) transporter